MAIMLLDILLQRPLSNDPRFIQYIYRYSHAPKRFVDFLVKQNMLNKKLKLTLTYFSIIKEIMWALLQGVQWLRGRVLNSRLRGRWFEPHRRHCIVVLEQDTFILA